MPKLCIGDVWVAEEMISSCANLSRVIKIQLFLWYLIAGCRSTQNLNLTLPPLLFLLPLLHPILFRIQQVQLKAHDYIMTFQLQKWQIYLWWISSHSQIYFIFPFTWSNLLTCKPIMCMVPVGKLYFDATETCLCSVYICSCLYQVTPICFEMNAVTKFLQN